MQPDMSKKLPDFAQAKVLVIGDVMLDRYWFGDTSRISPEAPVPVVNINQTDNRPGGAGNVALNITALGAKATLLGMIGQDEAAKTLMEQLSAAHVEHQLITVSNLSTIVKLRVISRHQQLVRLDFEENAAALSKTELFAAYQDQLAGVGLVILSDYKKGTLSDPQALIKLAHEAKVPVLVDPKGTDFSIYQGADIITPNLKEFEAVAGTCQNEQDLISKARILLTKHHIKAILITRGEAGMTLVQANETLHLPAFAREVCDVTGAGDTVIGVLGASLAAGTDLPTAVAIANLAASLAVNKLGAATVSEPELQAVITGKTNIASGILNDEQLLQAINQVRTQGKKIVFTNGCFDILHAGHVHCLQQAKELGDYLVVAVNSDQSIQKLKGPGRPINHLDHRMIVLAGLGMVDWVIPFADDTPERLLRLIKPDFLVKGGDYRLDQVVGANIVQAYGGEVRIIQDKINSTTSIIDRIQALAHEGENAKHG